jgi:hypothetical protein
MREMSQKILVQKLALVLCEVGWLLVLSLIKVATNLPLISYRHDSSLSVPPISLKNAIFTLQGLVTKVFDM